jgi:DNA-binding PadR family transcriptional regulator
MSHHKVQKMRYRSSEKTIINLLSTIAENKEYAQYDMKKAIGKNYRTILRYLPKLESCNLIQLSRTENSKKKGKDRKIYIITLLGIIELLKTKEPRSKDFVELTDKMAMLHPEVLPLVFGKWQLFDENQKILISLRLDEFVRQSPSHLNTIVMNTRALYETVKEEQKKSAQESGRGLPPGGNQQIGSFSVRTAQGYKTVATGEAALQTMFKTMCGSHDLGAIVEKVTKAVLSDWTINIEIDQQGNLSINKLTKDYFQTLSKDEELKNFMNQELSDTEEEMKIKLHLTQKFNQWWTDLSSSTT